MRFTKFPKTNWNAPERLEATFWGRFWKCCNVSILPVSMIKNASGDNILAVKPIKADLKDLNYISAVGKPTQTERRENEQSIKIF